ncbi:MAG: tRNA preQ1(34) S-adenosylmethionine ribosyltransferase-isomerase QueA [Anaerolineae bacterium]|jgi:S-adenosylmethionine:tRNA ribosyltransferase-isomerase|nr:tRNA preQ1(34) S-adenosylmethionine ribosyltransferase-isomerase QueA [Anaerolineae bacterium]MBT7074430.1 tRNA preQ1(34) S-adenosylmethionine ribosyltransferase-isomerase QueA [Anaerolineae bacterium]MBT7783428.1 tRNA preQ1(34) S-adenosylmethionine ribosyltransferase-isomerase QueA [Anaerolineae bacterium]
MKTSSFNYHLPQESIAQTPVEPRDSSRLLVLHRESGKIEHRHFSDIGDYLSPNDILVVNQTRVIPARIYAKKETGGKVELLLLRQEDELTWRALVGGKGLKVGKKVIIENACHAEIIEVLEGAQRLIRFDEPIEPFFPHIGNVPLPPYIHAKLEDPERYQTVYAQEPGSAAAPTAGLHFTPRLLAELNEKGINCAEVTLHVGLDTFAPVTEDDVEEHHIHTEWCQLTPETAQKITNTKQAGGRVVAVGTTSVRTLESASQTGVTLPTSGATSLFILPGYEFQAVDIMITNFHLPKSTLVMLVSAFAEREMILNAYETAIREGYRFYSFGDAMIIL